MTSETDYAAFNEEGQLQIHSEEAGASLSLADATPEKLKTDQLQQAGCFGATLSITGMLALATVLSASAVMFLEGTLFIYICFSGPIVLAPVIVYQRSKMEKMSSFREISNELREEVNDFSEQNEILHIEVEKLGRQKTRLDAMEVRFQQLCNRERRDAGKMRNLVKENAAVQEEIKTLQAADEIQALLGAILKADKDEDSFISEKELDEIMLRMKVFGGRKNNGIPKMNEEAIRAAFKSMITSQGIHLMRVHSALEKQRKRDEEEKKIDGSKFNPIMVSESDLADRGIVEGAVSEEAKSGGCCA